MRYETNLEGFFNEELKNYALYVIKNRACPNIMDGMRIGARKVIWAAIKTMKKGEVVKLTSLAGDAVKLDYRHADSALYNTIVQLSSSHLLRYHPIQVTGQIAKLHSNDSVPSPRYLSVMKSEYIDLFETDVELLKEQQSEGVTVEPYFLLPIVPVVLLYRTNNPGFGFSFRSFSYTLDSIIDNCIKSLNTGTCTDEEIMLMPDVATYNPENFIYNKQRECWYSVATYDLNTDDDTLTITDLPYDVEFTKFEENLDSLHERGIIQSFSNMSMDGKIKYVIKFQRGRLKTIYTANKYNFFKQFNMFSKIKPDCLNVIDTDCNSILTFNNAYELIDGFVKRRLKYYDLRRSITVDDLRLRIRNKTNIKKFIELVINDKLIINKRPIADIRKDLAKYELPEDVLKTQISKLTKEEIELLDKEISDLNKELEYILGTPAKNMYIQELKALKTKYKNN